MRASVRVAPVLSPSCRGSSGTRLTETAIGNFFDLIVTLSPEAHHAALELTRTSAVDVVYWPTFDPTIVQGSREQMLDAYRGVRDRLIQQIKRLLSP